MIQRLDAGAGIGVPKFLAEASDVDIHGRWDGPLSTLVDRGKASILIQDEGPGIRKERILQLEEPFREGLNRSTTAIGKAQGLGMSLLTSLARREGWGILLSYGEPGVRWVSTSRARLS